jgi:predicted nucleic acid-binding protein
MSKEVFIDTSGWFSLLVKGDPYFELAHAVLSDYIRKKIRAVTTDYVIDETATLLKSRKVFLQAKTLFELIDTSKYLQVEWVSEDIFSEAKHYFLKYHDHGYSFTDCISFIVMKKRKIAKVLTADTHFSQAGFTALL